MFDDIQSRSFSRLYGELRAALLSRHFALGRYFRTNYLSERNSLGFLEPADSGDGDDRCKQRCLPRRERPINPDSGTPIYADVKSLREMSKADQLKERWRISRHGRNQDLAENQLMRSGKLLTCLAIEHELGRRDSIRIIRAALKSIGSLYKFSGNNFDGYILRWDAVTSDNWQIRTQDGKTVPISCCDFFQRPDGAYIYCTPFSHPCYMNFDSPGRDEFKKQFRSWEPSMDELVGLITGYFMVFHLVKESDVQDEVRRQVNNLADYLAAHGYHLVRPCGGFTARGASGFLPAFEQPFGRVFERITGNSFPSRIDFEGVLRKAGVWDCLKTEWRLATVRATLSSLLVPLWDQVVTGFASNLSLTFLGDPFVTFSNLTVSRAIVVYDRRECFDVWNDEHRQEFTLGYLLSTLLPERRARAWWDALNTGLGSRPWAPGFAPYIALTGLDDDYSPLSDYYLEWLWRGGPDRFPFTEANGRKRDEFIFALAVGLILGADPSDRKLTDRLLEELNQLTYKWSSDGQPEEIWADLSLKDKEDDSITEELDKTDFMAALALTWLRDKRIMERRASSEKVFEQPPDVSSWPPVVVPADIINYVRSGEISLPLRVIQRGGGLQPGPDAELFFDEDPPHKPNERPVLKLSIETAQPALIAGTRLVTIRARDSETDEEIAGDVGIDGGTKEHKTNVPFTYTFNAAHHNATVFAPPMYAETSFSFEVLPRRLDVWLEDTAGQALTSVELDTSVVLIVRAVDAEDSQPVQGSVIISNPGRITRDPPPEQPLGTPVNNPLTNEPFFYIFRARAVRTTDASGDSVVNLLLPTGMVTAPDFERKEFSFAASE